MPFIDLVVLALAFIALSGFRVAQEYERGVVFRLGRFKGLRGPGLYWIIPLGIERAVTIDTRTRTVSAEQQETITRDSVTVKVNAVLWYRIVDAGKSVIAVTDAQAAVYQLALTSLRNIIGQHDLDEVLQERNKINDLLKENIAGSTMRWGLEIERFETAGSPRRIHAAIVVSRPGQRAIVIGKGGEQLKAIATQARQDMEKLFDSKVYLEVFVRVKRGWADDPEWLRRLGYE